MLSCSHPKLPHQDLLRCLKKFKQNNNILFFGTKITTLLPGTNPTTVMLKLLPSTSAMLLQGSPLQGKSSGKNEHAFLLLSSYSPFGQTGGRKKKGHMSSIFQGVHSKHLVWHKKESRTDTISCSYNHDSIWLVNTPSFWVRTVGVPTD